MRALTLFMLSVLMCAVASPVASAAASASPASVWWPAWTISSGEELSGGIEYSKCARELVKLPPLNTKLKFKLKNSKLP